MKNNDAFFPILTRAFLDRLPPERVIRLFVKGLAGNRPDFFHPWTGKIPEFYGPRPERRDVIVCVAIFSSAPPRYWEKD